MEFQNKAIIIGVNIRDIQHPIDTQHSYADVVLIDQSDNILHPLLYQVTSHSQNFQDYPSVENGTFAMIGEVLCIDKEKKVISLTNHHSVSYKYLIVASGLKKRLFGSDHDHDLSAGLHALTEALKIRSLKSFHFPEIEKLGIFHQKSMHSPKAKFTDDLPFKDINKFLIPVDGVDPHKSLDMALASTEKRLYQVQL